ncbi:pleckstrin homology domain-containing family G member 3 [Lissotriton helveticus]
MGSLEEKGRFEGLNRRISKLFDSSRLSAVSSSSSNDRMSIATSLSTDLSDSDRPVSLVSTASSDSLPNSHCLLESNYVGSSMTHVRPSTLQDPRADLDPDAMETPEHDSQKVDIVALSKVHQTHNNNNNAATLRGLRGSGSHSPFASKVGVITHKLSYVERVVVEIVETERTYVRDLRSIVEDYLGEIIDSPELPMKPEQVSDLFGNIEDIYALNSELLQDLDSCDNDPVAVASCFVEKSQYFDIYTQYCTNYPNSVAALTECMRSIRLAKFFRDRQEMLKHSLPLGSYLLKPVQRILKYHLLLQEIAKHFDMEEEGYEVVEEAIGTMTGVAWYINDMKRKHEHAVRLQEIQSLLLDWKGQDLTIYGELVLEGTFRVQRARNERTLFLFYRALFITRKRGDHFAYKTHIPCSSLMLIESTRESLCFTITHYKNNKHQYNIQVRTVEEKRLWTHHIKELILENHHAIIPQKAKEAILEMDALYPARYKYSPERVKKVITPVDPAVQARQGRRQSEPSKLILKHFNDKEMEILAPNLKQHADSEGALMDIGDLLQPSAISLVSSHGQSDSLQEDEVNGFSPKKDSPAHLNLSDTSGKDMGAEFTASDDEDESEILMGDDQVADFASSLLTAIHCWHYRAKALLFTRVATNKEIRELELRKGSKRLRRQSSEEAEMHQSLTIPPPDKAAPAIETVTFMENESLPESEQSHKVPGDLKSNNLQRKTLLTQLEGLESNNSVDIHDPVEQGETESTEEIKTLSSEDEEEVIAQEPGSMLPPSVLDHASIIAERFMNSLSRRSSVALDDGKYIGSLTPRMSSRSGSTKSLDCIDKGHCTSSSDVLSCSSPRETPGDSGTVFSPCFSPLKTIGSPGLGSPNETDRPVFKRKDSTLSKQDRLLLDKIKGYYDHAESNDAAFSIKRRESLSYIPAGVVRNSVFKFNSLPRAETKLEVAVKKRKGSSTSESNGTGGSRPASWAYSEVPISNSDQAHPLDSYPKENADQAMRSNIVDQLPITDAEFKPPSVMFKVWEEMERAHSGPLAELCGPLSEGERGKPNTNPDHKEKGDNVSRKHENGFDLHEPLLIIEDSDLSTINEESTTPSPESNSPCQTFPAKLSHVVTDNGQDSKMCQPIKLHPKILQYTKILEGDMNDKLKNKVYQLARKYSQRIKSNKPVVQRHVKELEEDLRKNILASVLEEKQMADKGKLKPSPLSLPTYDHVIIQEHSSWTPLSGCSSTEKPFKQFSFSPSTSPAIPSPGKSGCRSPLSPLEIEKFHWPDVRELRSKYTSKRGPSRVKSPPVNRSHSVPDSIAAHYQSDSANIPHLVPKDRIGRSGTMSISEMSNLSLQSPKEGIRHSNIKTEPHKNLSGVPALNPALAKDPSEAVCKNSQQNQGTEGSYFVSAEAPLENDKKVIVIEKACNRDLENPGSDPGLEQDDSYVHIRSPTSREKISLKAVIERCKAYQESEEYIQREATQEEEAKSQNSMNTHSNQKGASVQMLWEQSDQDNQSLVKNLRKKFQTLSSSS